MCLCRARSRERPWSYRTRLCVINPPFCSIYSDLWMYTLWRCVGTFPTSVVAEERTWGHGLADACIAATVSEETAMTPCIVK